MNICKLLSIAMLPLFASQATAETALTIIGKDASRAEMVIQYSMDDLKALDQTNFTTINNFVEAPVLYSGPLLREVIAPLTLSEDAALELTGLDGYHLEIPLTDAMNYDVIVAIEMNGAPMSIRDSGPLWIMYPISDHPELQDHLYNSRMVWLLTEVKVK